MASRFTPVLARALSWAFVLALACRYQKVYGAPSSSDDEAVFVNVGKVLAAFQETLVSGSTPFDQFRNALARGESPSSQS